MLNVEQKYYYTHAHARATTKYGAVRGNLLRISAPQKSNAISSYFEGLVRRLLAPHPLFEKFLVAQNRSEQGRCGLPCPELGKVG